MKLVICLLVFIHYSESLVYGPKIQICQGELQGTIENSITGGKYVAFKGIPYATPPVGDLRFLDPLPAGIWNGTLNATKYSDQCPQPLITSGKFDGNEDCLYLNVYTPSDFNRSDSLPKSVMVWIPGFEWRAGSGDDTSFCPDYLVAKDVIVVTINYRIGALGFLNLNDKTASGNQGLKDQVLALEWVKDNIARFGGNPDSVTIFGASVGAACVHYLALSSMADGLYHKVIAQSGTALNPWVNQPNDPRINVRKLLTVLGNTTDDPEEFIEILRTIKPDRLPGVIKLITKTHVRRHRFFIPTVDNLSNNSFMPIPITTAAKKGVKVSFLVGDVNDGGFRILRPSTKKTWNEYNENLGKALTKSVSHMLEHKGISVNKIREFYFGDNAVGPATIKNYLRMQTDLQYTYGIHDTVAIQVSKHYPTYMYTFSYDREDMDSLAAYGLKLGGFSHGKALNNVIYSKILSYYGFPIPVRGKTTQLVIDRVSQMWTDFAKTGDPNPVNTTSEQTRWKPVQSADIFHVMDISENLKMELVENINNRNLTELVENINNRNLTEPVENINNRKLTELMKNINNRNLTELMENNNNRNLTELVKNINNRNLTELMEDINDRNLKKIQPNMLTR